MSKTYGRNSLKLSQKDLDNLLNRIDPSDENTPENVKRLFRRFPFRRESVVLEVLHPGGSSTKLALAGRNLSAGGLSVLHSNYMHEGSRCVVWLPHPTQKWFEVPGVVKRCTHREGRVHEIGIAFDREIPARELLMLDSMSESFTLEHTDPEKLEGTLLVVDDDTMQHELIRKLLAQTRLTLRFATDIEQAVAEAPNANLILTEHRLGENKTASDLFMELWNKSISVPVVVVSSDKTPKLRETMRDAGAIGFIGKPLRRDPLLCALAEYMNGSGPDSVIHSTLEGDETMSSLVQQFIDTLPELSGALYDAMQSNDAGACREVTRKLIGQGASLGFPQVGRAAEAADRKLQAAGNAEAASTEIRTLLAVCQRVSRRSAA